MSTQVDKQELIDWIANLNDPAMLKSIKLLKEGAEENSDWWDEISEAEKESIRQGDADIKAGRTISDEEFWKKYEHRL